MSYIPIVVLLFLIHVMPAQFHYDNIPMMCFRGKTYPASMHSHANHVV